MRTPRRRKVRYAVVGLGHIAQAAVLPAFRHAQNSELVALVSGDPEKLEELGRRYRVDQLYDYAEYTECLESGEIDAVYIALPNDMHRDFTVEAARRGIHILCEKPLAVTARDCREMIAAAERGGVKLMTAYRLHFEEANLRAIEAVSAGKIGEPRIFTSTFTMNVVDPDNIRLKEVRGGGTLYDIGVYCINAARYIFRDEPEEVAAFSANNGQKRFREVDEMTSAILRFPRERLACFTSSFGCADVSSYTVVGTNGSLTVNPAFEYASGLKHELKRGDRTSRRRFGKRDQFAAELIYFSRCVQTGRDPEPSGEEGLADVRIVEALYASAARGRPVRLAPFEKRSRPTMDQEICRPPVDEPELVNVRPAHD